MNTIPTAEEFLNQKPFIHGMTRLDQQIAMIEFAKLHVKAALEAAYKNAEVRVTENALIEEGYCCSTYDDGVFSVACDSNSILNAYPLTKVL